MATLHVRNVPDKLYKRIQKLAGDENRSLTAEVVRLLNHGIRAQQTRQSAAALIERIHRDSRKIKLRPGWDDASDLIREDRGR